MAFARQALEDLAPDRRAAGGLPFAAFSAWADRVGLLGAEFWAVLDLARAWEAGAREALGGKA